MFFTPLYRRTWSPASVFVWSDCARSTSWPCQNCVRQSSGIYSDDRRNSIFIITLKPYFTPLICTQVLRRRKPATNVFPVSSRNVQYHEWTIDIWNFCSMHDRLLSKKLLNFCGQRRRCRYNLKRSICNLWFPTVLRSARVVGNRGKDHVPNENRDATQQAFRNHQLEITCLIQAMHADP